MHKTILEDSAEHKCTFLERKTKPSFPRFPNVVSGKVETRPLLALLTDGQLKENMSDTKWKKEVIDSACKH